MNTEKIKRFAEVLEEGQRQKIINLCGSLNGNEKSYLVTIIPGKKYTKVDVGQSGKYMIDKDGRIFGIKAYGVINKRKQYGTLDTIDNFGWDNYTAYRR